MFVCVLWFAAVASTCCPDSIDSVSKLSSVARLTPPVSELVALSPISPRLIPVDTPVTRPRAIEYSDWYNRRLTLHRMASYTMLPLFAAEYALGENLLNDRNPAPWMRTSHEFVAGGLGALFVMNTVTGVWNLWDSRHDRSGRTRRIIHSAVMLASDAGFTWAGVLGSRARDHFADRRPHRNVAIGSIAIASLGTAMMVFSKN